MCHCGGIIVTKTLQSDKTPFFSSSAADGGAFSKDKVCGQCIIKCQDALVVPSKVSKPGDRGLRLRGRRVWFSCSGQRDQMDSSLGSDSRSVVWGEVL